MGACGISFKVDGTRSEDFVRSVFEERKADDMDEYLMLDGYAGNWGGVDGITFTGMEFDTVSDADDYVFDEAKKYGPAIAARGKDNTGKYVWIVGAVVPE